MLNCVFTCFALLPPVSMQPTLSIEITALLTDTSGGFSSRIYERHTAVDMSESVLIFVCLVLK